MVKYYCMKDLYISCSNTSPFLCLHQKCCLALQRLIISDSDCSIPPVNIPQTVVMSGLPRRPKIHVSLEFVELLREAGYTWSQVAAVIGVSRTTLWRRIKETNTFPNKYSPIRVTKRWITSLCNIRREIPIQAKLFKRSFV